ncbi:hypothetical protein JT358_12035 [Micrococcales bacterium 31B]|nr:hypothetical protein [Micrococcales bacterium 31B]
MNFSTCLFVSTHAAAIAAADAWQNEVDPPEDLGQIEFEWMSEFDLEALAGIAVTTVHASGVICELDDVDLDYENLLALNEDMVQALADLNPEQFEEVAEQWAATEDFEENTAAALAAVQQITELARHAVSGELGMYCYTA